MIPTFLQSLAAKVSTFKPDIKVYRLQAGSWPRYILPAVSYHSTTWHDSFTHRFRGISIEWWDVTVNVQWSAGNADK